VISTQWSKRKVAIREEYMSGLANENESALKMRDQIESVGGEEARDYESLINLGAIAEKAKE
jgi:hypothetical protein